MASLVLFIHTLWVAVIVLSVPLIFAGAYFDWKWIRNRTYRGVHLAMMAIVILEILFAVPCPLTLLENWLRRTAGEGAYSEGCIEHWFQQILYYHFEPWVFTSTYVAFFLLILLQYRLIPPQK